MLRRRVRSRSELKELNKDFQKGAEEGTSRVDRNIFGGLSKTEDVRCEMDVMLIKLHNEPKTELRRKLGK
jgi:hypothetical protein